MFKTVCFRAPGAAATPTKSAEDRAKVLEITNNFKNGGYRMKQVFAETAVYCMGD